MLRNVYKLIVIYQSNKVQGYGCIAKRYEVIYRKLVFKSRWPCTFESILEKITCMN